MFGHGNRPLLIIYVSVHDIPEDMWIFCCFKNYIKMWSNMLKIKIKIISKVVKTNVCLVEVPVSFYNIYQNVKSSNPHIWFKLVLLCLISLPFFVISFNLLRINYNDYFHYQMFYGIANFVENLWRSSVSVPVTVDRSHILQSSSHFKWVTAEIALTHSYKMLIMHDTRIIDNVAFSSLSIQVSGCAIW